MIHRWQNCRTQSSTVSQRRKPWETSHVRPLAIEVAKVSIVKLAENRLSHYRRRRQTCHRRRPNAHLNGRCSSLHSLLHQHLGRGGTQHHRHLLMVPHPAPAQRPPLQCVAYAVRSQAPQHRGAPSSDLNTVELDFEWLLCVLRYAAHNVLHKTWNKGQARAYCTSASINDRATKKMINHFHSMKANDDNPDIGEAVNSNN